MIDRLIAIVEDESKWLPAAMGLALVVTILFDRQRRPGLTVRLRIMAAMNLFFGVMIGTMACGHLLAVTSRLASGRLEASAPLLYLIGLAIALPSGGLIHHARRRLADGGDRGRATLILNAWLALTLLALGIHNLPLAVPAFFNIGFHLHSGRVLGWVIVSMASAVNAGLFIGSLIFLASGQSFEQFSGME